MGSNFIPVIDLSDFPAQSRNLIGACEEWGCFRVVNHGIPSGLMSEMKSALRCLLDLPIEIKQRNKEVIAGSGYVGPSKNNPLYEGLGLYDVGSPEAVKAFCDQLDASPSQRQTILIYSQAVHDLAMDIGLKVAQSMGLSIDPFKGWPCQFRINKYNFTPETVGSSGVQIHTDSGFLTILQDDENVGGLEVMDKTSGDYVPVDPSPGTLLVNLGDIAKSVPVDCEVLQGISTITIEHLTGEVKPVERKVGDSIPGGARNLDGLMIVKATKTWKESMLSRIVQLTEEAQLSKPKLQRWLDKFGEGYSKAVVVLSVVVAFMGPFLFKWPFIGTSACRGSIYRALGLMVAASPCALAVAPLAYATAISSCARKGILLKGGHVLDALASCHTIAFDKTGTLTTGEFRCKAIEPIHGHVKGNNEQFGSCCVPNCEKEALAVAAAMEKGTTHPIGRAVVNHSVGEDLPSVSVETFENLPGRGLIATLSTMEPGLGGGEPLKASLGSVDYIASLFKSDDELRKIKEAVCSSSYGDDFVRAALSVNNKKVTLFHFEDKPRTGARDVIRELQDEAKLRVMMLTGDHELSAWRVANAVGIDEVYCGLKPEDKLYHVTSIPRDTGGGLVMVGDGINDAPALAAATAGVVLAERASAAAVAVADVLLLQDNISGVPFCIAKSKQTTSLVKQNVALALSSIVLASLTSVLGFLPLWLTVLLHEGGTLLVCLNSIRALNEPPRGSWKQFFQHLIDRIKSMIFFLFFRRTPTTIQPSPSN